MKSTNSNRCVQLDYVLQETFNATPPGVGDHLACANLSQQRIDTVKRRNMLGSALHSGI